MKQRSNESWGLNTLFVHGSRHHAQGGTQGIPTVQPIYASTTYLHESAQALDKAFDTTPMHEDGLAFVYARQGNPNAHALERVMTQAEGGTGAIACGSGMAAIHAALLTAGLTSGSKLVAAKDLYGATINLLRQVFTPLGVEVVMGDLYGEKAGDFIREEQPDVVFVETVSNPLVKVIDLDAISAAAKEVGAVTVVDSTFTTPYLVRPLEHGFDLVVHSATKYLAGHGDSTAGVVVSARNTLLDTLRNYAMLLGAALSPFESHLVIRGLRTLPLRMERQCSNALQVAQFLSEHPAVARVHYPGLPEHPQHKLASGLLAHGRFGGLLSFEFKEQTREAAFRFMDSLQLCLPATTLGDVFSLVSYPAISSHRGLTREDLEKMGITEGCLRLSVGIEDVNDIMQDLDQALRV